MSSIPNPPVLEINQLVVSRGNSFNLIIEHLEFHRGEILAILGPNGAGKSTLLLTISKLLKPTSGELLFNGIRLDQINDLEFRRNIALVLQDPLLFDTTVHKNIRTGLQFRGLSKSEQVKRTNTWMERLNIDHLKDRHAAQLSSGQAQRVSLARAMVLEPAILLLDEPFSPLDAPTRNSLIGDFRSSLSTTEMTTIFITHDQEQALSLGDRVAVILDGKLRQQGPPEAVFSSPSDSEIANFLGVENVLPGEVTSSKEGKISVSIQGQLLEAIGAEKTGRKIFFCLRPEDITIWKATEMPPSSARNIISGNITSILPQGPLLQIKINCGFTLTALITRTSAQDLELEMGNKVSASFKASAAHLIPR
jgi:tungstate transport system ATP-binding protein